MAKVRSWVGLDVHAAKVVTCVVDAESGEVTVHRMGGETAELVAFCVALPGPTRVAYEAGPTGYGLARALVASRVGCVVAAPGKIERPTQDKIKTDVRDAERLVRLLMIDALHAVRVPTVEEEALRDLVTLVQHCFSSRRSVSNSPAWRGITWIRRPFRLPCWT